ncbi:MAG TPA: alpha/beta fold hydrolase [Bryobacteraceae bacterium]|nr:alpha/beta fold hydrolase [Bryobacteraceae bacterium]
MQRARYQWPLFLLPLAAGLHAQTHHAGRLDLTGYTLSTFDGGSHPAELGHLEVPAHHAGSSRASMRIAFVRLRSTSGKPRAPIVFLSGGPGVPGIVMGRIPIFYQLFERLRRISDVILLDQRGVGLSSPNLDDCHVAYAFPLDALETAPKLERAYAGTVSACAQYWRGQGIDLTAYNTNESADDLEDLRIALGTGKISLLGTSYGTELGLVTIRRHPDSVERAVFQGTQAPESYPLLPSTYDVQLRKIARLVSLDPQAAKLAPDLVSLLQTCLEKLGRNPARIGITRADTKEKVLLSVGQAGLQQLAIGALNGRVSILPALLRTISEGDFSVLAPLVEITYNDLTPGLTLMGRAMDCAAVFSPERIAEVHQEAARSLLDNVRNLHLQPGVCREAIGSFNLGPEYALPIYSEVPALFLSGTLDTNTPPFTAEKVRWGFPNGVHIVIQNGFHETLPAQEVQDAVFDFFNGEDVAGRRIVLPPPHFDSIAEARANATKPRH